MSSYPRRSSNVVAECYRFCRLFAYVQRCCQNEMVTVGCFTVKLTFLVISRRDSAVPCVDAGFILEVINPAVVRTWERWCKGFPEVFNWWFPTDGQLSCSILGVSGGK